ncbi:MAG: hypothetical protein RL660_1694 [Bacteroidota bacterium]|jgi:uncharacterized protein YndB with AHSA1/START domain
MHTIITIAAHIPASKQKVWDYYTMPEHITQWNFAHESWHCPSATNDLRVGGTYRARVEARDGSFGFDFEAVYTDVIPGDKLAYTLTDNRKVIVKLEERTDFTGITISFDAENENPIELQEQGWQAILQNFKQYTEAH